MILKNIASSEHFSNDLILLGSLLLAIVVLYFILSFLIKFVVNKLNKMSQLEKYHSNINLFQKISYILLRIGVFFLFFGVLGYGGYNIYKQKDLKELLFELLQKIPDGFWMNLGISFVKVIVLIYIAKYIIKISLKWLASLEQKALLYKQIKSNDESIAIVFARLEQVVKYGIILIVLYTSFKLFSLPEIFSSYTIIVLKIFFYISFGLLIVNALTAIIDSLDALSAKYAQTKGFIGYYDDLRHLIPIFKKSLEYIIYATVATLVLKQLSFISSLAEFGGGVIQAIGLIFIARVIIEIINLIIDKTYLHEKIEDEQLQRNKTIYPILKSVIAYVIYFIIIVMIMRGFGFDPIPLLAGAGILGMVIGLGAQSLVNDLVSGFFIIFEGTFSVGDKVDVNSASGVIEEIGLRTTKLRSDNGTLVILQNGKLGDIVNYSSKYINSVVDIGVDSKSNLKRTFKVLSKLGTSLNEKYDDILEDMKIVGIEKFSGPEIIIRTSTKVKPGVNTENERMIRMEILAEFEKKGIKIPFNKRQLVVNPKS